MLDFWTYILRCSDGSYYVGHTDDIDVRLGQHQDGTFGGYTSSRRPVELLWSERFLDRDSAFAAERQIKGWSRAKKEALIRSDWAALQGLASRVGRSQSNSAHPEEGGRLSLSKASSRLEGPIIVLVRPQLGENIGKAARAMLNFGLTELRLVEPRDGWPNPDAGRAASGADEVIEGARLFPSVAEAVADCAHVYATTVRKRGVTKPVLTPAEAAREVIGNQGRSAILFGPERSGLETEDVALARTIITVPVNPEFPSLNLAQAVILCACEWWKQSPDKADTGHRLAQPTNDDQLPPAPQHELEDMIAHFERLLKPKGYFRPPSRATATKLTLRSMLTKPGWNHLEVRTMRGILSALEKPPREKG